MCVSVSRRVGMRNWFYPGIGCEGTEDIHFGERVFFRKKKRMKEMVIKKMVVIYMN